MRNKYSLLSALMTAMFSYAIFQITDDVVVGLMIVIPMIFVISVSSFALDIIFNKMEIRK